MRKFILMIGLSLALSGCASQYPSSIADPNQPTKVSLTPTLRKAIALVVIARNPGVVFTEASISKPSSVGFYDTNSKWTTYQICTRWQGIDSKGKKVIKYTVSYFSDGKADKSTESNTDSCSFLKPKAEYQPFPELSKLQNLLFKKGMEILKEIQSS